MLITSRDSLKNLFEKNSKNIFIQETRKNHLLKIANSIAKEYKENGMVNLVYICIHNSRRSQFAQIWSFFAADYFELNIHSFSGGIEVTSLNRTTIKTLQKAGFLFQLIDFSHQNPKYEISFEGAKQPLIGFSKLYNNPTHPESFIAITNCSDTEKYCLNFPFEVSSFHLPFEDPKRADGTLRQEDVYKEISLQIAGEIFVIFNEVKQQISSTYLL